MRCKLFSMAIFLLILLGGVLMLGKAAQIQAHGEIESSTLVIV